MQTIKKQPSETRFFGFDFKNRMFSGSTISTVFSLTATPSGLTIGTPTISGSVVYASFADGAQGVDYTVTCQVVTSAGEELEYDGILSVREET